MRSRFFAGALALLGLCATLAKAAPFTLTTGTGDGSVTLGVDGFGCFGDAPGLNSTDATYDPIGPTTPTRTTFDSAVAIRVGPTGARTFLASGTVGGSGGLTNPVVTGTSTTGTSTFTHSGMNFTLVQTVAPTFNAAVRSGSLLTQTYTITNPTAATIDFELVRYLDGWFVSVTSSLGGRVTTPQETLFEQEAAANSAVVGITGQGGTIPVTSRYEAASYSGLLTRIIAGNPLANIIQGDSNADGLIEPPPYDVTIALRNTFSLAPGATTTYTTLTFFGTGTPSTVFTPPTGPGPTPPQVAGPEGSYTGSNGATSAGPEGGFGFGARTLHGTASLLGPFVHHVDGPKLESPAPGIPPWLGAPMSVYNVSHRRPARAPLSAETDSSVLGSVLLSALALVAVLGTIQLIRPLLPPGSQ